MQRKEEKNFLQNDNEDKPGRDVSSKNKPDVLFSSYSAVFQDLKLQAGFCFEKNFVCFNFFFGWCCNTFLQQ